MPAMTAICVPVQARASHVVGINGAAAAPDASDDADASSARVEAVAAVEPSA